MSDDCMNRWMERQTDDSNVDWGIGDGYLKKGRRILEKVLLKCGYQWENSVNVFSELYAHTYECISKPSSDGINRITALV